MVFGFNCQFCNKVINCFYAMVESFMVESFNGNTDFSKKISY